jgi:ribosomal protein L11 methyltransferase
MWAISFRISYDDVHRVVDWIEEKECTTISWAEDESGGWSEQYDDDMLPIAYYYVVEAYFEDTIAQDSFSKDFHEALTQHQWVVTNLRVEKIDEQNWEKSITQPSFEKKIGDFWIAPTTTTKAPSPNTIPIFINASMAFGSGEHPTTQGCLEAISYAASIGIAVGHALDLGCGSGILAIAMAKRWPNAAIFASDMDTDAVEIAIQNTHFNQTSSNVHCVVANGFHHPLLERESFDLIVANILLNPLLDLGPIMAKKVKNNGCIIVSGILKDQELSLLHEYEKHGFFPFWTNTDAQWGCILFQRSADHAAP